MDPKSQLGLPEVSVEEELHQFLKDMQKDKQTKESLKSITYQNINQNALKSYEDQQDYGELIKEHN